MTCLYCNGTGCAYCNYPLPTSDAAPITIDQLSRYRAEPGDTVVLRVGKPLTPDMMEQIRLKLQEAFPEQRAIVLEQGMSLEVAGEEVAPELVDANASPFDMPRGD